MEHSSIDLHTEEYNSRVKHKESLIKVCACAFSSLPKSSSFQGFSYVLTIDFKVINKYDSFNAGFQGKCVILMVENYRLAHNGVLILLRSTSVNTPCLFH